jgi:hypothetical protein
MLSEATQKAWKDVATQLRLGDEARGLHVVPKSELKRILRRLSLSSHPHCRDAAENIENLLAASPFTPESST